MKFGAVEHPEKINFELPEDHPDTKKVLNQYQSDDATFNAYVGCAKWGRSELKGFYPRGTKDELTYYSGQFNSIELNATFYGKQDREQYSAWAAKTPQNFKFFPKIPRYISHIKWLKDVEQPTQDFVKDLQGFDEKLGVVFLQMKDNFLPKNLDRLAEFIELFPQNTPLAVEVRNTSWFNEPDIFEAYSELLKQNNVTNIIVDTAGRRDLLHMRLTTDSAFIRYVGANHESDYPRLDDWVERVVKWRSQGLKNLYFFVHQNEERESPKLSAYFIEKLNKATGLSLHIPATADNPLGL